MADHHFCCRVCGIEFPDVPPATDDWFTGNCPTCGEVAVVCRGPVLCSACGIEYHCETAWLEGEVPVAKCPTCGSTAEIRHPEPAPPAAITTPDTTSDEVAAPAEEPAARPGWSSPPWPPTPWPPPDTRPAVDTAAAFRAAERVTGVVLLIFVIACALPTFRLGGDDYQPGIIGLLCGWITCFFWFPNPLLFFGCRGLLSGHFRYAFTLGILACICTLPIFALRDVLANLSWGFYVWQANIVLYTIASGILLRVYGERVDPPRK